MNQLKLASHNSWSYLKPTRWWMYLFLPFSKCQSKNIQWQLKNGVEMFDLRIRFKHGGCTVLAHGLVEFDITSSELNTQLKALSGKSVRVLLERRRTSNEEINCFKYWVLWAIETFPDIHFVGGHGAHGKIWGEKYVNIPDDAVNEYHASVRGMCLQKIWPYLYAKQNNPTIKEIWDSDAYLMLDYVNF